MTSSSSSSLFTMTSSSSSSSPLPPSSPLTTASLVKIRDSHRDNFRFRFRLLFLIYLLPVYFCGDLVLATRGGDPVSVETKYGTIQGLRFRSGIENLTTLTSFYDRFYGIPYAEPPVGDLRFEPPRPAKKWPGILEAVVKKPSCPQIKYPEEFFYVDQSEDCLYLNIFTPHEESNPGKTYPVIFYIHGGSYESGSGHIYEGRLLSLMGVVVVTINYRLGVLGFLTTGDSLLPGNYGLRDVMLALRWVHENIGSFRGDVTRVTLVGQSVGGSLVGILMTMPSAKNLFWAAIAHSGSATALYSIYTNNFTNFHDYVRSLAATVNCSSSSSNSSSSSSSSSNSSSSSSSSSSGSYDMAAIKECLKKTPYDDFVNSREKFPLHSSFGVEFRPIVDNDLMFEHPREAIIAGRYHKVPFYTGVVENEFTYFINDMSRADHIDNLHLNIELFLNHSFNCKSNKRHSIVKIVKYNYIDWVETEKVSARQSSGDLSVQYDYGGLINDIQMISPTLLIADLMSQTNKNVYYWFFRHPNSCHMFELNYLFGVPFGNEPVDEYRENKNWNDSTIEDRMLSEKIIRLWVSIAETSKPGPIDGLIWPEYNTSTQHYITISAEPTSINRHFQLKTNNFWNVYLPEMFQDICENSLYEGVLNRSSSFFDFSIANPQDTVEDDCKNGRSDGECDERSGNSRSALVLCYVALPCLVLLSVILAFVVLKFKRKNAKLIRTIKHLPTSRAV